jgi:hypothetical protein
LRADAGRKTQRSLSLITQHGENYFGGKRHELKAGEVATACEGKPPSAAMQRAAIRRGEQRSGKPRLDLRGKKLIGKDRKNAVWIEGANVPGLCGKIP